MRLTPRGDEVKAIVALLESDGFDSAEALAKAVIKELAERLSDRNWYAWVYRETGDASYLSYGPFTSESEAMKFAGKYVGMLKGQHMILPLYSTNGLVNQLAEYKVKSLFCLECDHSLVSHEHPKKNGKCAVRGCKCKRKVEEE